jgi:hypothetical protein
VMTARAASVVCIGYRKVFMEGVSSAPLAPHG